MRTTIELKDEHRARLLEIAARRGAKGFSALIEEAVELYLEAADASEARRKAALALRGRLSPRDANGLRAAAAALRESWR
ncbi:MAG: ribbon-helix-helix protein, CopG family [Acidobacteria bacterium]|nr:ribbon-helix-helix protein, CopG family [Acidobacteriota bacterium]